MLDPATMEAIVSFLDVRLLEHKGKSEDRNFSMTWFGGEPLLAINRLEGYSQMLIDICTKHG